jgi:hypothetical protein
MKPETNEEKKKRVMPKALEYLKKHKTITAQELSQMFGIPDFCFISLTDNPCITYEYKAPNAWEKSDFKLTYKGE